MTADRNETAIQATALAITLGLIALAVLDRMAAPTTLMEAPKPTQIAMSMVEEPPPPAPPAPEPPPEPPPPVQTAPSPLPLPPPPRPRHVRPRPHPPFKTVQPTETPPQTQPQSQAAPRPPTQAPENHLADATFVGRLHAIVERHVRPPDSPAWRLTHPSGEVLVAFRLSRGGAVSAVHVLRSSGFAIIDAQGVSIVAAQTYPPMPADVFPDQAFHDFTVPVSIRGVGAAEDL